MSVNGSESPAVRASDADRDRVVHRLRDGAVDGRLTHDSFVRRIDLALSAVDQQDLDGLLADLPRRRADRARAAVVALVNASRARVTAVVARLSTRSRGRSLPALLLPSTGRPVVTIGRSLGCDLVLGDSTVSRRHAKLRAFGGQWFLEDLGSTNGTRVNGIRIRAATVVRPGASVGFGRLEFLVDGEPDTGTTG